MSWRPAILCLLGISACRFFDLYSTWLITPDLRLEKNGLIRLMGWRRTIILNAAVCLVVAAIPDHTFLCVACALSVLATFWNLHILRKLKRMR